jgi:hypothetical protein
MIEKNGCYGRLYRVSMKIDLAEIIKSANEKALSYYPEIKENSKKPSDTEKLRAVIPSIATRMIEAKIQDYVQKINLNPTQYGLPNLKFKYSSRFLSTNKLYPKPSQDGEREYILLLYEDKEINVKNER